MSALINDPVFIILTIALLGTIGYNVWQVVYRNKAWKQVVIETNLKFESHNNKGKDRDQTLSGVYRHRQLALTDTNLPVYRNGKRSTSLLTNATTNIHAALSQPQTNKLTLKRVSSTTQNTTPIGNEEFDHRFKITCEPEGFARAFLARESLRQKLLQLKPGGMVEIKENEIVYDQTGRVTNAAQILLLFDVVCSLAEAVEAYRD